MGRSPKPLILIGLAITAVIILVSAISWFAFPDWRSRPGGLLEMLGVVTASVVTLTGVIIEVVAGIQKFNAGRTSKGKKFPSRGTLPEPGPLPNGSRMPFSRNEVFTGREKDLLELADGLFYAVHSGKISITQPLIVSGIGGIGKSQLAVELCYRYGRFLDGVHWVSAINPNDIGTEVAACGMQMGLPNWPEKLDEQIATTLHAWCDTQNRLVVLDNLEDLESLRPWLPKLAGLRVMITTRNPDWPREIGVKVQLLGALPRSESRALLRKLAPRLGEEKDAQLDRLAEHLGDMPLALHLTGCYLEDCACCSIADYLAEIKKAGSIFAHTSQKDWTEGNPTGHLNSLEDTFALSWQRLAGDGKAEQAARLLFRTAGYCAPNTPIPDELLWQTVTTLTQTKEEEGMERAVFERAKHRLIGLGLITATHKGPMIHPLLAQYGYHLENGNPVVLEKLTDVLAEISGEANDTRLPEQFLPLCNHIEIIAQLAEAVSVKNAGKLWNELGCHKRMVADFQRAKSCFERAQQFDEQTFGVDDPNVATDVNDLGSVLQDVGEHDAAKACYERALRIDEQVYGPENIHVARDLNNLGNLLQELNDPNAAKIHLERALQIAEKAYGAEEPEVATMVNNLGGALQDLGDLDKAKACYERALAIDEKVFGPDHPNVAIRVNNLGLLLQQQGDFARSQACYERALRIDEQAYGAEHPIIAIRANNLGAVLQEQGNLSEAKKSLERAMRIFHQFLPPNHPNIQLVQEHLDIVERKLRERDKTKTLAARLVARKS